MRKFDTFIITSMLVILIFILLIVYTNWSSDSSLAFKLIITVINAITIVWCIVIIDGILRQQKRSKHSMSDPCIESLDHGHCWKLQRRGKYHTEFVRTDKNGDQWSKEIPVNDWWRDENINCSLIDPLNYPIEPSVSLSNHRPAIERIIVKEPCIIILWNDNTKTVSKCNVSCDTFDINMGIHICIIKKVFKMSNQDYKDYMKYVNRKVGG